jgi:hypothetical protein
LGWLDDVRLVIQQNNTPALSVLNLSSILVSELAPAGAYLGTFPAALT